MRTKPGERLTLRDRLSRLTFTDACKLLGPDGKWLIKAGSAVDFKLPEDVYLGDDLLRVSLGHDRAGQPVVVSITLMAEARQRLHYNCTHCRGACEHVGQADKPAEPAMAAELRSRLTQCVEQDESGRQRLTVTLPDKAALHHLADALAQLLAAGK